MPASVLLVFLVEPVVIVNIEHAGIIVHNPTLPVFKVDHPYNPFSHTSLTALADIGYLSLWVSARLDRFEGTRAIPQALLTELWCLVFRRVDRQM